MANNLIQKRIAKMTYSFAVDGGTFSATPITPSVTDVIPLGSIINDVTIDCTTACTGTGATIVITGGGITLCGSTPMAISSAPFTAATMGHVSAVGAITTAPYLTQKASANAPIKVTIGTANLTAGVFNVYVDYTFCD